MVQGKILENFYIVVCGTHFVGSLTWFLAPRMVIVLMTAVVMRDDERLEKKEHKRNTLGDLKFVSFKAIPQSDIFALSS